MMAEAERAEETGFTLELILSTGEKILRMGPALQREGVEQALSRMNEELTGPEASAGKLVQLKEFGWVWVRADHVAAVKVRRLKRK